ncbi:MAG: hypothetical protein P8L23_06485 [Flavobacteriales bacterium]|nr:hypothetical protein [Flavobacteriales bacterium]
MKGIVLAILLFPLIGFTQKFDVSASKTDLLIGEPTVLKLNFSASANNRFDSVFFEINETDGRLVNNWEIWNKSPISKTTKEDEKGNFITYFSQEIELANFDTGKVEFPPLLALADEKKYFSQAILFNIKLEETSESDEIKPLKPIKQIKITWFDHVLMFLKNYWIWIASSIAIVVLLILILRHWLKKPLKTIEEPKIPISIILLKDLEILNEKKYWQNGKYKKYYSDLSIIIWRFLEDRYEIATFEKTSDEILNSLKWKNISDEIIKNLQHFFVVSDEVKFAKQIPIQKDNVESFNMIKKLIEDERIDVESEHVNEENNA